MTRVIPLLILTMLLTGCVTTARTKPRPEIRVGEHTYQVEVARTLTEQQRGLSGRQNMEQNAGMLFPYSPKAQPSFWMKDMRFAIDILWLADSRVVGIEQSVQPDNGAKLYPAPVLIDAVLELNNGVAARDGLAVGDAVAYPPDTWK